jgi:hypothetical protein
MPYLEQLVWEGGVPVATDVAPPGAPPSPAPGSPDFTGPVDTNPQPGDPNFTGPVDTSTSTDGTYTLPIEIFNGVLPPIVIQTGGAPTIPSPIPTTLPTTTPAPAPVESSVGFWVVLAAVGAILFSPSKKKRR